MTKFLAGTHSTQGIAQTVGWPCQPIIFLIRHFEGPTEVQLVARDQEAVRQCKLVSFKG